jgi:hypothetical protein
VSGRTFFIIFVVIIVALGVLVGLGVIPGKPGPHISDDRPN